MLNAFTLIPCCQLAGELIVTASGLPVPGPACGMALMFAGLVVRGGMPDNKPAAAHLTLTLVAYQAGTRITDGANSIRCSVLC